MNDDTSNVVWTLVGHVLSLLPAKLTPLPAIQVAFVDGMNRPGP